MTRSDTVAPVTRAATFRANVGIVVAHVDGSVAWFERADHRDSWQFPQGGMARDEAPRAAAARELREETRLKVPEPVLRGSLKHQQVFDNPNRSLRGRTITHAFLFHLNPQSQGLSLVKGGDDAADAFWVPLNEALGSPEKFFEDHHAIIETMVGKL